MNQATLIGRVGADPRVSTTKQGFEVVNFSIATSEKHTTPQGEVIQKTDWHSVVAFGNLAIIARKFLKKGSEVFVQGKIRNKRYVDKNGIERFSNEIELSNRDSKMRVFFNDRNQSEKQSPYSSFNQYQAAKDGDYNF